MPLELNKVLINHFIPTQPPTVVDSILLSFRNCLELDSSDILRALAPFSASSAPGPDKTSNSVWKRVNRVAPCLIPGLPFPLVSLVFHPLSLQKADSIVIDKPGKPSYNSPPSFPVIVLLQTFSQMLESIMTRRLSSVARVTGLLDPHQCGSLAGLSTSDACTTLSYKVKTLQMASCKVSTLFLDIKGDFNNVNSTFLGCMRWHCGVNPYIVSWTQSFLTGRFCGLLFLGSPKVFSTASVSTPLGSPISLLLFVIYVSHHRMEIPTGLMLAYVDDFALSTSWPSYR